MLASGVRTIGVTSARSAECKRGLAANLAVALARTRASTCSVAVVDADPHDRDVSIRLGDPSADHGRAHHGAPRLWVRQLRHPLLHVIAPSAGGSGEALFSSAAEAIRRGRDAFDLQVVDLPVGCGRPGPTLDAGLLDVVDTLLVATTASTPAIEATCRHIDLLASAQARGHLDPSLDVRVVVTGDETSAQLGLTDVLVALADVADVVVGSVVQLWGRSAPNRGFGPTLGIPSLDRALVSVLDAIEHERGSIIDLERWRCVLEFAEPTFA